jgi:hypothetical protein
MAMNTLATVEELLTNEYAKIEEFLEAVSLGGPFGGFNI